MTNLSITRRKAIRSIVSGLAASCATSVVAGRNPMFAPAWQFSPNTAGDKVVIAASDLQGLLAIRSALPEGAAIRTADGYGYDVLPGSAAAFDEHSAPDGFQLETTGGSKLRIRPTDFVSPEMVNGDLHMAAACAAVFKVPLITAGVDYEITTAFTPHDITWISNGTRIKQMSTANGVSVLRPKSNVKHIGRTYLYLPRTPLPNSPPQTANRGHVMFGDWRTGMAYENFHFDEFVFEGGHPNVTGLAVAGGCHNVRGHLLDGGKSQVMGRVFMAHWANFSSHYVAGGGYQHALDATPTTHPHDIVIDEVRGDLELQLDDFCALWAVSAGYDIHVGRVTGRCINGGAGPGDLVLLTAGDLGFAYASPDERAAGMWGLTVGSAEGYCSHAAVHRVGLALYSEFDSTPQDAEHYYTRIQDTVGYVEAVNAIGNTRYCGVDGHNGYGRSSYGTVKLHGFKSAWNATNHSRDSTVEVIEANNCQSRAIQLAGFGANEAEWPIGVNVATLRVNGTGLSETTASTSNVAAINKIFAVHIGRVVIDKLKDMPRFAAPSIHILADARDVTIGSIFQNWIGNGQTSVVKSSATGGSIEIGHIQAPLNVRSITSDAAADIVGYERGVSADQ